MNGTTTASPSAGSTYDAGARPITKAPESSPLSRVSPPEHQSSPRPKSPYHTIIVLSLARQALGPADPRLVEGWMRLEHSTFDGLDRVQFDRAVAAAVAAINVAPHRETEELARSYGL